jgi:DUF1680 family protein
VAKGNRETVKLAGLFLCLLAALPAAAPWRDQGIIHIDKSPYAKLHSVPVRAVTMGEGFWAPRRRAVSQVSIPTSLPLIEESGVMDNFRRLTGKKNVPYRGPVFADSDIYKWIDGVGYELQSHRNPALKSTADQLIGEIVAVQEPNGYLGTTYTGPELKNRLKIWTGHETYNLGHMLQGAIAFYRGTGDRTLLDAGARYVAYLYEDLAKQGKPIVCGHPEIEMAAIELYRTTGDKRALDLAGYLLNADFRESLKLDPETIWYSYTGKPFLERTRVEGHAVRAMYALSGATDYYLETGDPRYKQNLERIWQTLVNASMYITGGVGARAQKEAIGEAYELPNNAYGESCAAIGSLMWNWRMLAATGEARFADVMERALYNGINSGLSLDGRLYCYQNPLEGWGLKTRNPWYYVACCPPNIERTIGALPGYLYSTSRDGIYIHFFHSSVLDWHREDGAALKIMQTTGYPWKDTVELEVAPAQPAEFTIYLRIPGWSPAASVAVNGRTVPGVKAGAYLAIKRKWSAGDKIAARFDLRPRLTAANPRLADNIGKAAVERGPLVYCLEQHDQTEPVAALALAGKDFTTETRADFLGGIVVLHHKGQALGDGQPLYGPPDSLAQPHTRPAALTLIPYYAWENRGAAPMKVWIPYHPEKPISGRR